MKRVREKNVLVQAIEKRQWEEVVRLASPELVNTYDEDGYTPLMRAAGSAPEEVLIKIIDNASEECVKQKNNYGSTILHHLSFFSRSSALRRVLAVNADNVNTQDNLDGRTPLHYCLGVEWRSFEEHRETAKILMEFGAMPTIKDNLGDTPIDLYKLNPCSEYDKNLKDEQKKELLKILEGGRVIPAEILARGPGALTAYFEALKEGETEVNQGRTIIMGLERVGKTSTIRSFLKKEFNPDEPITDAIATNKTCIQDSPGDWNEAAEDKFPVVIIYEDKVADSMAEKIINKPKELPVSEQTEVEKITQDNSQELASAIQSIEQVPEDIAYKTEDKLRSSETVNKWKTHSGEFVMDIWDFGGQPIYNVIQRIYIPSYAVVCVVFNLEHDLDRRAIVRDPTTGEIYKHRMTYLDFILHWIRSVYVTCTHFELDGILGPPIILIGTHRNKVGTSKTERIENKIWKALEDKPYAKMVFSKIFTIENSEQFEKSGAADVMKRIFTFSKKMVRRLPLKWLLVCQEIQKLREKHICLQTSEINELLEKYGIKPKDQLVLLRYLHDTGEILYYPNDSSLKDTIVVDLLKVVELSKTVITVIDPEFQDPIFRNAWQKLNTGILEEALLKHLWEKLGVKAEFFDFFVSLLQSFGLLCQKQATEGEDREFCVLSRLKPVPPTFPRKKRSFLVSAFQRVGLRYRKEVTKAQDTYVITGMEPEPTLQVVEYGDRAISLFHDLTNYLPEDVFQRAVTKFIEKFQMKEYEPKLCYEHVELNIDEKHYVILSVATIQHRRFFKTTIIRTAISTVDSRSDEEPEASVCKQVLSFLNDQLSLFCPNGGQEIQLRMYVPCVCCRANHWHNVRNFDKDVLPCGTKAMDVTRHRRLLGSHKPMQHKDQEEGPSTSQTAQLTTSGISQKDFQKMLLQVSKWYDDNCVDIIDTLIVLYKDIVPRVTDLEAAENVMDLFELLKCAGHLTTTNYDILIDTANLTGTQGVLSCNETLNNALKTSNKTAFSTYRQKLVKFGNKLLKDDIKTLAALTNVPRRERQNQWTLILNLERRDIISEDNMESFITMLKESCLSRLAKELEDPVDNQ